MKKSNHSSVIEDVKTMSDSSDGYCYSNDYDVTIYYDMY